MQTEKTPLRFSYEHQNPLPLPSEEGWIGRKVTAIPKALYFGVILTVMELAEALFNLPRSSKQTQLHLFNAACYLQEAWGWLVTLFSDQLGQKIVLESQFMRNCYENPVKVTKTAPKRATHTNPLTQEIEELSNKKMNGDLAGVYITTNESNPLETQEILKKHPIKVNSCHIGFSGWHNLDIMAERHSSYGVICDFNPKNALLLEETLRLVRLSESREEFLKKMGPYLEKNRRVFSPNIANGGICVCPFEETNRQLDTPGSWLSSDRSYQHIRRLALEDKVALVTEDVRNTATFKKLVALLRRENLVVDTLYMSNIPQYMKERKHRLDYTESVRTLIEDETLVIQCPIYGPSTDLDQLRQEVVTGKTLLQTPVRCLYA